MMRNNIYNETSSTSGSTSPVGMDSIEEPRKKSKLSSTDSNKSPPTLVFSLPTQHSSQGHEAANDP
jgi:hypothetical protein